MRATFTTFCAVAEVLSLAPARAVDPALSSLSSMLSGDAEIYFPGSEGFASGTLTLAAKKPQLDALVRVATEEDVRNTVFGNALARLHRELSR